MNAKNAQLNAQIALGHLILIAQPAPRISFYLAQHAASTAPEANTAIMARTDAQTVIRDVPTVSPDPILNALPVPMEAGSQEAHVVLRALWVIIVTT
jgi:hypothetical protein